MRSTRTKGSTRWIDFAALREQLDLQDVLEYYGVTITSRRGDQISCFCPLPDHPVRHEPGKRTASFSGNVSRGCWQCFGCSLHGNAIDLALLLENQDPSDRDAVRDVALKLADVFDLTFDRPPRERNEQDEHRRPSRRETNRKRRRDDDHHQHDESHGRDSSDPNERVVNQQGRSHRNDSITNKKTTDVRASVVEGDRGPGIAAQATTHVHEYKQPSDSSEDEKSALPTIVNPPLGFELQNLDVNHPYLASRGLKPETVGHFGLGYCSRGMLKNRIAIPLHDSTGQLVGYAGRLVDDTLIDAQNPKYLFPGSRERDGQRIEFRKSMLLYNAHRIAGPVDDLVIVEGFASVWHLHQLGHVNVVALMGAACSDEQARMIANLTRDGGHIWLMPDGDNAGEQCALNALKQLTPDRFCRWISLKDHQQPTDLDESELTLRLSVEVIA